MNMGAFEMPNVEGLERPVAREVLIRAYLTGVLDGTLDTRANYPPSVPARRLIQHWLDALYNRSMTLVGIAQSVKTLRYDDATLYGELWCIQISAFSFADNILGKPEESDEFEAFLTLKVS